MNTKVIITDGSQPIGKGIGPNLEARDVLYILKRNPGAPKDLEEKSIMMADQLFKLTKTKASARDILESGKAYKKMKEIIRAQNGKSTIDPNKIKLGKHQFNVKSTKSGKIEEINNKKITKVARIAGAPVDKTAGIYLFKRVNGFSNEYWGWGFEDDDLLLRLTEQNVFTDFDIYEVPKENTSGLYIHGDESYIECKNIINIHEDFTIHCTFKPDEIIPDYDKSFDEMCVFSIPGWDTTISYNSFNRYKFECWDIGEECHQITSNYSYPRLTKITVTYSKSNRMLKMYQDGKLVGKKTITRKIKPIC